MKHINLLRIIPGFNPKPITEDQWQVGGVTGIAGKPLSSGHWFIEGHIPPGEWQANTSFDSFNCTGFGYTNRLEILWHRVKGIWRNFSDRWIAIVAGTVPGVGNDSHTVGEAGRKFGLLDEADLPFDSSIQTASQFYAPKPPSQTLLSKAKSFLEECVPLHDWVDSTPESLKYALQYSPLGVAVSAWFRGQDGLYYFPPGMKPNHDTTLVDYEEGSWWLIFDSYPDETGSYLKRIKWDTVFQYKSKRYILSPGIQETQSFFQKILDGMAKLLKDYFAYQDAEVNHTPLDPHKPQVPQPTPMNTENTNNTTHLDTFCLAIQSFEGWKPGSVSYVNNNPGNIKGYTDYTKSLGATGKTASGFTVFPSYEVGFKALKQLVTDAAHNELKAYKNCTIRSFFQIYAPSSDKNNPAAYATFVANKTGLAVDSPLLTVVTVLS